MSKPKFKIGDRVRVLPNGEQLKNYHGGWVFGMKGSIGKEYTITRVVEPTNVRYPFYGYTLKGNCWVFDERNLELVKEESTKKKPKFKVGDKVRVLPNGKQLESYHGGWISDMEYYVGKEYTIKKIAEENSFKPYPFCGYLLNDSPWTFDERNLKLVKEEEKPANIIFKFKKNKIIAKREGGLKATACCHPDDTYDISLGMRIALERLLDKEKEEKDRRATNIEGFYMCTKSADDSFSSGNIYSFKNGIVRCDFGIPCGPYKEIQKRNKTVYIGKAVFEEIKWEYA